MAAYGINSIFKTTEKEETMRAVFLEIVAQKLHEQQSFYSPILHPLDLVEPQKSFFAGPNEQARFYSWLTENGIEKELNAALYQNMSLPKGITPSDFEGFLSLPNIYTIIDYIFDGANSSIAAYAVKEDLLTEKESKKALAIQYIHSFCDRFNLDPKTFVDYQHLSHLHAESNVSLTGDLGDSSYSMPDLKKPATPKEDQLQKIKACQTALQSLKEKDRLDREIAEFCSENAISMDILRQRAQELPQKEDPSTELGLLNRTARLLKRLLELKDYDYETAIKAMKTFQFIRKYESLLNEVRRKLQVSDRQAREIITICSHGLTEPYFIKMAYDQYEKFVTKEENTFPKIKDEIYYRVAEKGIAALKDKSSESPLMRIKVHLQYIMTIIELASYDCGFFSGKKIHYFFNKQSQEKYIPPLLYDYYMKLQDLIKRANSAQDQDLYLSDFKKIFFQLALDNGSIHGKWHIQFLTDLHRMANVPEAVTESSQSSTMRDPPTQGPSSSSSSSVSFQYEDQRRRGFSGELSEEIHSNELPQNSKSCPATLGRTSPS